MSALCQKRTYAQQQKQALYSITSSAHYRGKITRLLHDLHCPRKEDEGISIDEQRPHPMRRKNLRKVRTLGAKRNSFTPVATIFSTPQMLVVTPRLPQ